MRSSQSGADGSDVCALLPREEAGKILGYAVRARLAKRSDGATECRYAGGMAGTVTVMVGTGTSKANWDTFMKELRESGASLEPAAGVGDGAFFWDALGFTRIPETTKSPSRRVPRRVTTQRRFARGRSRLRRRSSRS